MTDCMVTAASTALTSKLRMVAFDSLTYLISVLFQTLKLGIGFEYGALIIASNIQLLYYFFMIYINPLRALYLEAYATGQKFLYAKNNAKKLIFLEVFQNFILHKLYLTLL
jgi:hypothetical protein